MAAKKRQSALGTLINAVGFILAAVLVMHIVFVLFKFPAQTGLQESVAQAAGPLALFFPGLIDAQNAQLQVLLDFGLAALFWVLVAGFLGRVFS